MRLVQTGEIAWMGPVTPYSSEDLKAEGNSIGLEMEKEGQYVRVTALEKSGYGFGIYADFIILASGIRGNTHQENLDVLSEIEQLAFCDAGV